VQANDPARDLNVSRKTQVQKEIGPDVDIFMNIFTGRQVQFLRFLFVSVKSDNSI